MHIVLFLILIIILAATPFVVGLYCGDKKSKDSPIVTGLAGMVCVLFMAILFAININGTLSSINLDTSYNIERVIEVTDDHTIIYAEADNWPGNLYYEVVCSSLRNGCLGAEDWPKRFKLVSDGDKFVIVELKATKNDGS